MRSNKVLVTRGPVDVPDQSARGAAAPRESGFANGFANLTEAVDAVAAVDALLASLAASRAVLMESVREWVADRPELFDAPQVESDEPSGLAPELVARLARALRVPESSAVALVEESRALVHEHPRTLAALRGGHITHAHAQTILGYTDGLRRANRVALETRLLKHARTTTAGELSLVARTERERRLRPERRPEPQVVAGVGRRRQRVSASPTGRPTR
jgi:2-oxoglutarate dehydrogenase complex dehydrogenase (E1) component-like enzyme